MEIDGRAIRLQSTVSDDSAIAVKEHTLKTCLIRIAGFLGVASVLAGCATMTPEECKVANWFDIGLRDGAAGESLSVLDDRRRDCAETRVAVDSRPYLAGRDNGLRSYCRLENAARFGLEGKTYNGVCPPAIDSEFRARFELGKLVYSLRNEVSGLDDRIEAKERNRRNLDRDEEKSLKDITKDEERRRIRKEYELRRDELRDDLRQLDRALGRTREQLRDAEYQLGYLR